MEPVRCALRLGQYFARVDPNKMGTLLYGMGPLEFTKENRPDDPFCAFTYVQPRPGDVRLLVRPESVPGAALSIDATEYSGAIAQEFMVKPNVTVEDWGGYEALNGWVLGQSGIDIILAQYDRDGQKYGSACLTVVRL